MLIINLQDYIQVYYKNNKANTMQKSTQFEKEIRKGYIYQDQTVQISQKLVRVLKFYFPQDSKNEILFKDINKLALKQMDQMDESLGVDPQYFKDFNKRIEQNKNMYIEMAVQDQSVRLCFAPQQPLEVMKIIERKWEQAKIQKQKALKEILSKKDLYENSDITAGNILKTVEHEKQHFKNNQQLIQNQKNSSNLKTEELQQTVKKQNEQYQKQNLKNVQNQLKRGTISPGTNLKEQKQGQSPKKKVKQSEEAYREKKELKQIVNK